MAGKKRFITLLLEIAFVSYLEMWLVGEALNPVLIITITLPSPLHFRFRWYTRKPVDRIAG